MELRDVVVPLGEGDDVCDVAAAPLVDRLVVVPDHAELCLRTGQELDQTFLGRVDVLVLVHDQVPHRGVQPLADRVVLEGCHRSGDLLAVGQEPIGLECSVEVLYYVPERLVQVARVQQLVVDDREVLQERAHRREQPHPSASNDFRSSRVASRVRKPTSWLSSSTS